MGWTGRAWDVAMAQAWWWCACPWLAGLMAEPWAGVKVGETAEWTAGERVGQSDDACSGTICRRRCELSAFLKAVSLGASWDVQQVGV